MTSNAEDKIPTKQDINMGEPVLTAVRDGARCSLTVGVDVADGCGNDVVVASATR